MSKEYSVKIFLTYANLQNEDNELCYNIDEEQYYKNILLNLKEYAKENQYKFYDLSSNKNKKHEEEILIEIKKNSQDNIVLVTNNKKLFTNFNRPIYLTQFSDSVSVLENLDYCIEPHMPTIIESLKRHNIDTVIETLKKVIYIYGNEFEIDLELLTKETTYKNFTDIDSLVELLDEDFNLFRYKHILTSRLSIIIYRLCFFDLHAKKVGIGKYFSEALNVQSKPYKFNKLNNNHDGFFFTDLESKQCRGYKIPREIIRLNTSLEIEKINIAKRFLKSNVKMKIVAQALELDIDYLKEKIYKENKAQAVPYPRKD